MRALASFIAHVLILEGPAKEKQSRRDASEHRTSEVVTTEHRQTTAQESKETCLKDDSVPRIRLVVQSDSSEGHRPEHPKVPHQLPVFPLPLLTSWERLYRTANASES